MEILTQIVNFFLGLGASVFVPFIMIIAGLIVRMKVKDAISSGITLAVAFTGMNLIISFMKDSLNPAAQAIMSATGMSFPVVDGGWTTMATISWSWPYAFLMFPLLIGINVLMILLNKTNTINADLWNVWLKIFTAVAVASITKSVILAFVVAAVQVVVELKSADANQHRIDRNPGSDLYAYNINLLRSYVSDCLPVEEDSGYGSQVRYGNPEKQVWYFC